MAAISPPLSFFFEDGWELSVLMTAAVATAVSVEIGVGEVEEEELWAAAAMTSNVRLWESVSLVVLEDAWIVMLTCDGWISEGTSPVNVRLVLSNLSHAAWLGISVVTMTSEEFKNDGLRSREKGIPIVAFKLPIVPANIDLLILMCTMALAISPWISTTVIDTLKDVAPLGGVPEREKVALLNVSQLGVGASILVISDMLAVFPSNCRVPSRPEKVRAVPTVALTLTMPSLNSNLCCPTTMLNLIAVPANPNTSDAINCNSKVCGGCTRAEELGVCPENVNEAPSNVSHAGKGVFSRVTA
jgi:hypothetical protein